MTQYARPNSDAGDAEWRKQNGNTGALNQLIDETSTDDSDYMMSVLSNPMSDSPGDCKIALGNTVTDPVTALDDHKVKYRAVGWDESMMGAPALIVSLYDTTVSTSTPIATVTNSSLGDANMAGDSFVTYTLSLSSTEAGNIESYDDLQIWFKRQGGSSTNDAVRVSQAWFECADVPEVEEATTSPAFLLFFP